MSQTTLYTQPISPAKTQAAPYNLPTNWDTSWSTFVSNWTYPPPVNPKLLEEFRYSKTVTLVNGSTTFLNWAAQNSTRPSTGNFGAESSVVHIGDVIEVEWRKSDRKSSADAEPRSVRLSCAICETREQKVSIFNSCSNYTDKISNFNNQTVSISPHEPLVLQRLHNIHLLKEDAVGICYMSLSDLDGNDNIDYTYPFPVSAAPRTPRHRFSLRYPGGSEDITLTHPTPVFTAPASGSSKDKPSVGIIVGVVIAVFVFTCLVVAIVWFVWTRTKGTRAVKRVDTPGTEDEVEMQRVQNGGVQRRIDRDDDGEAPPAYHESLKHEIVTDQNQRVYT